MNTCDQGMKVRLWKRESFTYLSTYFCLILKALKDLLGLVEYQQKISSVCAGQDIRKNFFLCKGCNVLNREMPAPALLQNVGAIH